MILSSTSFFDFLSKTCVGQILFSIDLNFVLLFLSFQYTIKRISFYNEFLNRNRDRDRIRICYIEDPSCFQ